MSQQGFIDPAVMAYLAQRQYRPGETDMPQYVDPSGLQYFGRYTQGPYGGEGSTPTMTLDGYSAGRFNAKNGGKFRVYDRQGKDTGQDENWNPDSWNWDTAAMAAAGLFGAGAAALAGGAGGAGGVAGAANGSWDILPEALGGAPNTAAMGAGGVGMTGDAAAAGYGGLDAGSTATIGGGASVAGGAAAIPGGVASAGSSLIPEGMKGLIGPAATLLGAAAGAKGQNGTTTQTRDIPDWLKPYVTKQLEASSTLLDQQMAPGFLAGYDRMRDVGQGFLSQPVAQNGFSRFYPGR
jgi:hypothetical protein